MSKTVIVHGKTNKDEKGYTELKVLKFSITNNLEDAFFAEVLLPDSGETIKKLREFKASVTKAREIGATQLSLDAVHLQLTIILGE